MTGSRCDPLRPLKGASHQIHLIDALIFLLLMTNVFPDYFFVPTYRRDKITPGPEVLPDKVAFPL